MSLLAGFDFVTEISNETIRKVILNNLKIGGVSVVPPFELTMPISAGVTGTAHMIVNDLQVDLNANDTLTLTLAFDRTSVMVTAPLARTVCPLSGTMAITAAVQLVDAGGSNKRISLNMGAATVAITWSAAANQAITQDLAGLPITPAQFTQFAVQALTTYVRAIPAPAMPLTFRVVPGTNGSISPTLQFEKLEVHCIENANRSKQALGIFGILLAANHANGNHTQKTATAITAANDGVCVSFSPGAFHSLVFCPGIAAALGTTVANLPGTCGPAGGFETQGVTVKSLSDTFANGRVDINGSVAKSGFCYEAKGKFHGALTLSVTGSTITPNVTMDEPDIDVDIPWYCWLVAAVVAGPIGIAVAAVVEAVVDKVADNIAGDALRGALGSGISGVEVGGLSGATFSSAVITTEGLTLQGKVPMFVSTPFVMPQLKLSGSVITTSREQLSAGTFHGKVWCKEAKDYPYKEYAQQQRGSYQLTGTMVSLPLTPHFTIEADGPPVTLSGSSGTIELPNVTTHYESPLATGGASIQQPVHVTYTIADTTIQLTNLPSEGNYALQLNVTAVDCAGQPVKDNLGNPLTAVTWVQFEGNNVEIGGGYETDVQECAHKLRDMIKKLSEKYKRQLVIPDWPPVNYPPPERIIEWIRDLVAVGVPEMDEILVTSKIAHRNSYYRGILSPAARKPGLLKEEAVTAVTQKEMAEAANLLVDVSRRLMEHGQLRNVLRRR